MKVSSVLTPYLLRLTAAHNTATIVMYSPRWTFATRSDFSRHMWIMIMKLCWQHDANFNPVFSNFAWYVVSFYINKYKCTNSGLVLCITIQYTRCFIKTSPSLIVHKCGKCWQIWIFFFRDSYQICCDELIIKSASHLKPINSIPSEM